MSVARCNGAFPYSGDVASMDCPSREGMCAQRIFERCCLEEQEARDVLESEERQLKAELFEAVEDPLVLHIGDLEMTKRIQAIVLGVLSPFVKLRYLPPPPTVWKRDPSALQPTYGMLRWLRDFFVAPPLSHSFAPAVFHASYKQDAIRAYVTTLEQLRKKLESPLFPGFGEGWSQGYALLNNASSHVCLEGGNVKFWRKQETWGAMIGLSALLLTIEQRKRLGAAPVPCVEPPAISSAVIQAMLDIGIVKEQYESAMQEIANELKLDIRNIVVLEHADLHIDLQTVIGPNNKIFVDDPQKGFDLIAPFLEKWNHAGGKCILASMQQNLLNQNKMFERNKALLEAHRFEVVGVPGRIKIFSKQAVGGYLLNGLLFKAPEGYLWISPAISYSTRLHPDTMNVWREADSEQRLRQASNCLTQLAEHFFDAMAMHGVDVAFCNNGDDKDGAIHCLSREDHKGGVRLHPERIALRALPVHIPTLVAIDYPSLPSFLLGKEAVKLRCITDGAVDPFAEIEIPCSSLKHMHQESLLSWPRGKKGFVQVYYGDRAISSPHRILPGHPQRVWIGKSS